jgi:predicted methyltransferase
VSLGNPEATFREIARALKPGGRLLAIDHEAAADAGPEVGGTLHRIHGGLITDYAEAAGLSVVRTSSIHRNPEDQLTNGVFDPSIQGRTDKFVILFEK